MKNFPKFCASGSLPFGTLVRMNTRTALVRLVAGWNFPDRRGFNFDRCFVLHGSIILYLSALSRANFRVFRLFADCTFAALSSWFGLYIR